MKIELDGKTKDGFSSVGKGCEIDCEWAMIAEGTTRLPIEDDAVEEVFSSHFLQRYTPFRGILNEICRVCRIGAVVELHVPHWLNSMAMGEGQQFTFGEQQARHLTKDFVHAGHWSGVKRLALTKTDKIPAASFREAQGVFPHLTDEQIMKFIPDTCHEIRFYFAVVRHT